MIKNSPGLAQEEGPVLFRGQQLHVQTFGTYLTKKSLNCMLNPLSWNALVWEYQVLGKIIFLGQLGLVWKVKLTAEYEGKNERL